MSPSFDPASLNTSQYRHLKWEEGYAIIIKENTQYLHAALKFFAEIGDFVPTIDVLLGNITNHSIESNPNHNHCVATVYFLITV